MVTGLVRTSGTVRRVDQRGDCMMTIAMGDAFPAQVGDSICCSGICLTVIKIDDNAFKVSLSAETMTRTTARNWAVGTAINLEPSLSVGDSMGGHFVSGHVDGLATVLSAVPENGATRWTFMLPEELAPFVASKGSIAINGVSLTVNEVEGANFGVNIIPHTAAETNFSSLAAGEQVNIEIDMLARYVARLAQFQHV